MSVAATGRIATAGDISKATADARAYLTRAERVVCRGVPSFARVRERSVVVSHAHGAHLVTADGTEVLDLVCGFGPVLLGHGVPEITEAVSAAVARGSIFGAPHEAEYELASELVRVVPSAEKVAFATSGSEAVHAALRIARGTTGRQLIVRFEGHFHGWLDPIFSNAPGAPPADPGLRPPLPLTPNVEGAAPPSDVVVARWNDLEALELLFDELGDHVAGIIMEPFACNMGTLRPLPGYLEGVQDLCRRSGALLIFDEVLTGFRLARGGAQELLGVTPDLTIVSKAMAAGFPISAVVGSAAAMESAAGGSVRPSGTFAGGPVPVAAALATLRALRAHGDEVYTRLEALGGQLESGLEALALRSGAPLVVQRVGSVLQLLWAPRRPVADYAAVAVADAGRVRDLAEGALDGGVFAAPRGLILLSAAHTEDDIAHAVDSFADALAQLGDGEGSA